MATLESIQARIKKLETQAQALKAKAASGVLKQIHDLMDRHEISIDDVAAFFGKGSGNTKAKFVGNAGSAKYVDPKTGASWSGRGRAPAWIAKARDRSVFLTANGQKSTSSTTVSVKRRTAARKGPQPALYRDPVSGNTWSGFGRAPAWIATAKDRSAFLIAGNGVASEGGKAKTAPKKPAAAEKSATRSAATAKKTTPSVKKAPAKKATARKATAKQTTAKKATAKKATAKKATAKKATTKKATVARKGAAAKAEDKPTASKRARSTGARPPRKTRSTSHSEAPVVENSVQGHELGGENSEG